jgi:hypothetical protein
VSYRYRLYGLALKSEETLPGLEEGSATDEGSDVLLQIGAEPDWVRQARSLVSHRLHQLDAKSETDDPAFVATSYGKGRYFGLLYTDGTQFITDAEGRRLWGAWTEPWTKEDFATYLLGPAMGFVLRRRGVTPLHASAVCVAGKAIVFCGDAQAGKSTTAAGLGLRGAPVLCEDIAALRLAENRCWVEPGYPRVCLWPDSVERLMGRGDALPLLTPNWQKRYLPLDGVLARFEPARCPVGAVYVLAPRVADGNAPRIEKMTQKEALLELVQNTYMNWLLDREQRAREFDALTQLALQVAVRRIVAHGDPKHMAAMHSMILADAESLSRSAVAARQPNPS